MSEFPASAFRLDGDPGAIRGSAGSYAAFGAQAADAAGQIRSLDTSLFVGPEGDQYRSGLKESLPPHLDVTGEAYSLVASALNTFAGALSGLQDRMAPLAVRAPGLWQEMQAAQGSLAAAQAADRIHAQQRIAEVAAANAAHPLPPDTYVSEAGAAGGALSAAEQAWTDCLAAAGQVKAELHTAIDACCSTIRRASGMRFKRNPHGLGAVWSGVTHFVKDHVADLARLSSLLKKISFVTGMMSFIPVIGEAALVVSMVTGGAALALDATTMAATGHWDAGTLAWDAVALAPMAGKFAASTRAGRYAGGFAKSVATDVKAVRVRAVVTPEGTMMVVRDGKTTGQMLTDAHAAGTEAASGAAQTGGAANSGLAALSPEVRANVDDAIRRAGAGKVRFHGHDGKPYLNSDGLLPSNTTYTEWTAAPAGAKRGVHRVIVGGNPANPTAIYYWDHVHPPVQIGP